MQNERWQRIKELFTKASALPTHEREAFLAAEEPDPALRTEVHSLLAAHFSSAAGEVAGAGRPEGLGSRFGPYTLLEVIGEGGFGVVYAAEQQAPIRRRVALKIIKPGMDSKQVVARFEQERQALALMEHPNIARVFDGGTTPSGRPFFVMELVKGDPITGYCDREKLTPDERLRLFLDIGRAVQHAHQKGVIHRDLKPSNVLVTLIDGRAIPKVIDFGVAKATHQRLTEKTLFTEHRQMIGTPLYMSPEQAHISGVDVDTRSDVYSLGVLLYELLTGTTPFAREELLQAGLLEMHRVLREVEPPKPSTRVATLGKTEGAISAQRRVEVGRLSAMLQGDLDWIVMKCLEKERARRYDTANDLVRDVERHLGGEAVLAAPPALGYRLRKMVRRRRAQLVTVAAMGLVAVLGGVAYIVRGEVALRAEKQLREEAQAQTRKAELAYLPAAQSALLNNDLGLLEQRLNACPDHLRGFAWNYLKACGDESIAHFPSPDPSRLGLVWQVAFSDDGSIAYSAFRSAVYRWSTLTGQSLGPVPFPFDYSEIRIHGRSGRAVLTKRLDEALPDGRDPGRFCVYVASLTDGKIVSSFRGHLSKISAVAVSPDGQIALTASEEGAFAWRTQSGELVQKFSYGSFASGLRYDCGFLDKDAQTAALVTQDRAHVFQLVDGARVAEHMLSEECSVLGVHPDGRSLLMVDWDGPARWVNAQSGESVAIHPLARAENIALDGGSSRILASSWYGTPSVVSALDASRPAMVLRGHHSRCQSVAFSSDGEFAITGDDAGSTRLWDVSTMRQWEEVDRTEDRNWSGPLSFSADGSSFFVGEGLNEDSLVRDRSGGRPVAVLRPRANVASGGFLDRGGTRLFAHHCLNGESKGRVAVYSGVTGEVVDVLGHENVTHAMFSGGSNRMCTLASDGTIRLWDSDTLQCTHSWTVSGKAVTAAAFSPRGDMLATVGGDHKVTIWSTADAAMLAQMDLQGGGALHVAFDSSSRRCVVACGDGTARVYSAPDWALSAALAAAGESLQLAVFSPDDRHVVTCSDRAINIFAVDPATDSYRRIAGFAEQDPRSSVLGTITPGLIYHTDGSRFACVDMETGAAILSIGGQRAGFASAPGAIALAPDHEEFLVTDMDAGGTRRLHATPYRERFPRIKATRDSIRAAKARFDGASRKEVRSALEEAGRECAAGQTGTEVMGRRIVLCEIDSRQRAEAESESNALLQRFRLTTNDALGALAELERFRETQSCYPRDANLRRTLGVLLYRAGLIPEAIIALGDAAKRRTDLGLPAQLTELAFLAMAQSLAGEVSAAAETLELAKLAGHYQPPFASNCREQLTDEVAAAMLAEAARTVAEHSPKKEPK